MIQLRDLAVGYDKHNPVLTDLNYKFDKKIYGIVGQSGVGKTTTLKTIAKLIPPLHGYIIVPEHEHVYMMHQHYTCFDWLDCLDNILIAKKIISRKITDDDYKNAFEALEKVGLQKNRNQYPSELSGGMRQRLALARTIFVKPDVILMDEPLSSLDEELRREMQNLILNLHKETNNTIIMVTHSQEDMDYMCDRIWRI